MCDSLAPLLLLRRIHCSRSIPRSLNAVGRYAMAKVAAQSLGDDGVILAVFKLDIHHNVCQRIVLGSGAAYPDATDRDAMLTSHHCTSCGASAALGVAPQYRSSCAMCSGSSPSARAMQTLQEREPSHASMTAPPGRQ